MFFDENGDPIQYGILGFHEEHSGVNHVSGPWIGIILSVHPADDGGNHWYQSMQAKSGSGAKAPYLEATVFVIHGDQAMGITLPNCLIIPKGRCSTKGVDENTFADWTEDVPRGSTPDEVERFRNPHDFSGIEALSGDWVLVNFIGGLQEQPFVQDWYPSPYNLQDAATTEDGVRWVLRRNGTEQKIDKNGEFTLTHRAGHYLQLRGEEFSLKHSKGALVLIDEKGDISIQNKDGVTLTIDKDGVTANNGESFVEISGSGITISSPGGATSILAKENHILAEQITATAGGDPNPLLMDSFVSALLAMFKAAAKATDPATGSKLSFEGIVTALEALVISQANSTKVLYGE